MSELKVTLTQISDFTDHPVWRKFVEDWTLVKAAAYSDLLNETLPFEDIRKTQREVATITRMLDYPKILKEEIEGQLNQKENNNVA